VVIDPISAYLGAVDSHKNSDVRGLLAPLSELAQRRHVAIIGVTHLNKSGGKAIYRTMGSLAFVAAARAVWGVVRDEERPTRRLLLPVKNNLGPEVKGLAYEIQTVNGAPSLLWETEPVEVSMDDALYQDDDQSELDDAAEWLQDVLSAGRVPTTELQKLAKQAGHSWRTVQRAKGKTGVESQRDGFGREGKFYWAPPIERQTIQRQTHSHTLAAYDETRAAPGFAASQNGQNRHRAPTVAVYGDGALCEASAASVQEVF
jgi:putative DNA primase/helicase